MKSKSNNKDYIQNNIELCEEVLKSYVVVNYVEKAKSIPELRIKTPEQIKDLTAKTENAVEYLSQSFEKDSVENTQPTGLRNIDMLLEKTKEMSIDEIQVASEKYNDEKSKGLLDSFEKMDSVVSADERTDMVKAIRNEIVKDRTNEEIRE